MTLSYDAVVVGGGVVGAATALALRRQRLDVALVERGAPPVAFDPAQVDPRVYAISPGSIRLLQELGVWPAVAAARVSPYERMRVWERDPGQALVFDAAEQGVAELGYIVEESLLRAALWAALRGVDVHAASELAGFGVREGQGWVRLANGEALHAAVVVSAEGIESKLRGWAGIEPVGWSYPQRAVVCHVATERPHGRTALQRFLPGGPLAFLPLADGRSSIVWSTATVAATELMALPDAEFRARLGAALGDALGAITAITPRQSFPLRLMHAEEYVRPHLALVGDSAHVIHPLAGQGVNLGLADAAALAGVLAAARAQQRPLGALRMLKRYERARRADNLEMLALTDALHRAFGWQAPAWHGLLNLGMRAVDALPPLKRRLTARAMGL